MEEGESSDVGLQHAEVHHVVEVAEVCLHSALEDLLNFLSHHPCQTMNQVREIAGVSSSCSSGSAEFLDSSLTGCKSHDSFAKQIVNNARGYNSLVSRKEQSCSLCFLRTMAEWNRMSDETVYASSASAVTSALGRLSQGIAHHLTAILS